MAIKLWIVDEISEATLLLEEDLIVVHTSVLTQDIANCKNVRLADCSFHNKVSTIERVIYEYGKKGEKIEILTQASHVELTYAAIQYALTFFPKQLKLIREVETWSNPNVLWNPKENFYQHVHHLIERNQFVSAEVLLRSKVKNGNVYKLLDFAKGLQQGEARFPNANHPLHYFEVLENVYKEQFGASQELSYSLHRMKGLVKGNQVAFLYFLQSYVKQLYESNDLVDFIVMYYRLVEELLLYAMGWNATNSNRYFVRNNVAKHIAITDVPSRHFRSYLRIVKREVTEKPNAFNQKLLQDFSAPWLRNMIDLRHEGVSGHGFQYFTKELFEQVCEGNPVERLEKLMKDYDIQAPYSIFKLVQKAIVRLVRNELSEIDQNVFV